MIFLAYQFDWRVVTDRWHLFVAGASPSWMSERRIITGGQEAVDAALERWLVADALATLTPEHRSVLVHTYYAGRTVTAAAAVLGVPSGTVKSRVFYALRALRLALEERGVTS